MNTPDSAPATDQPAAFLFRFFAHFIDAAIVGVPANLLMASIRIAVGETSSQARVLLLLLTGLMPFLLMIPYAGYCYSRKGTTVGKMILGLKVQKIDGSHLDFWMGGIRDVIGKSISLLIVGIGFLLIFFRPDKRALHDLIFETEVRKVKPIRPMLVIAGIFTAIFNFQFSNWNASFLMSKEKPAEVAAPPVASPSPVGTPTIEGQAIKDSKN